MILHQLTLRNFGLFRGRQVFDLTPGRRNGRPRPIVLFGGINGGGKTTLFDALQLALYGPRARCSKRLSLSYDDFLLQSIHHGVSPYEGAGVALSFRYTTDGEPHDYEVCRDWQVQDGKLRENLLVNKDGVADYSLSRGWPQLVEELIPLEISQLFFFDGEKIRALAEDASSSETLGAAVKALLGLDLVERLITDAAVLQTRLTRQGGTPEQRARAEEMETQFADLKTRVETLRADAAALENRRQRAAEELRQAEATFTAVGGRHVKERDDRDKRLGELTTLAAELEARLVALAGGELPLALVPELLGQVAAQDEREGEAIEAEVVARLLEERDRRLLQVLREAGPGSGVLRTVHDYLEQDRQARRPEAPVERRLLLSQGGRALLRHLLGQHLAELRQTATELLERLAQVTREREDLERALAATPAEADIGEVVARLKTATENLALLNDQARRQDGELMARKAELAAVEGRLRKLWEGDVERQFEREDVLRMVRLAGRTRDTMQDFLRRATERKIDRLSGLITESFRYLLRKQTLVERILIDPATFAVTLYDAGGAALSRQRLSEGEKQIFAVAMLWGLARASARPLPAVIDTPMARLDAAHRKNLVERYFPSASHQVVVLSTDTEVDRQYYEMLRPAIARAYHLTYDERARVTVGEEGYFW
jgi:DNA sulfur modification protein DndD